VRDTQVARHARDQRSTNPRVCRRLPFADRASIAPGALGALRPCYVRPMLIYVLPLRQAVGECGRTGALELDVVYSNALPHSQSGMWRQMDRATVAVASDVPTGVNSSAFTR
jgi:hypothetical protein